MTADLREDEALLASLQRDAHVATIAERIAWAASAVLLLAIATGCGAHRLPDQRPESPPRLEAHLAIVGVTEKAASAVTIPRHPFTLHAWVTDPEMVFPCPSEEWLWPDGTRSVYAADCDPEVLEPYHAGRWYHLTIAAAGEYVFKVVFASGGRQLVASARMEVAE